MNIKRIVLAVIILIAAFSFFALLNQKPKYNLILISIDTLRQDHMGVYGYNKNTTPNIDAWAKKATVFTNAFTIFPLTFQSFYTLFTGTDEVLKNDLFGHSSSVAQVTEALSPTLPQILKSEGFKTSAFVTNPVIDPLAKGVFRKGFDEFNRFDESGSSEKINPENARELFYKIFNHDYQNSIDLTEKALDWLSRNDKDRFFTWLHYTNPHQPYIPPQQLACKFNNKLCNEEYFLKTATTELPSCTEGEKILKGEDLEAKKALYDAELVALDEQIGKILDEIKRLKLEKNTIIVFYADHGESFEHEIMGHGYTLYNADVKIPLIIYHPENKIGKNNLLVDNIDVLPTLLRLLNIGSENYKFNGIEFSEVLKGNNSERGNKLVYFKTPQDFSNKYGVTDGKTKYIQSNGSGCLSKFGREETYDLINDEDEQASNSSGSKLKNNLVDYFNLGTENHHEPDKIKSIGY